MEIQQVRSTFVPFVTELILTCGHRVDQDYDFMFFQLYFFKPFRFREESVKSLLHQALLPLVAGLSFSLSPFSLIPLYAGDAPPEIIEKGKGLDEVIETKESKSGGKVTTKRTVIHRSTTRYLGMKAQALQVYNFLNEDQINKAVYPFDAEEREEWQYRPTPNVIGSIALSKHSGISIMDLTPDQKLQLSKLLDTALSNYGMQAVTAAVEADRKAGNYWSKLFYQYGPENYYLTFFGNPRDAQWGWKFEGHMISLNFTIRNQQVEMSPIFIGTTHGQIQLSRGRVAEVLKPVVQSARELVQTMDDSQVRAANTGVYAVPKTLIYAPGVFTGRTKMKTPASGLPYESLSPSQKNLFMDVLESYQSHFDSAIRSQNMRRIRKALQNSEFVWAGDVGMHKPFYFRLQSPEFILEFLGEDGTNGEYHSVWINL